VLAEETVSRLQALRTSGASIRRIVMLLGISRNTARRYLRQGPPQPRIAPEWQERALQLFDTRCKGNASSVARVLRNEGVVVSTRTIQRLVRARRRQATTPPSASDETNMLASVELLRATG
jgi:transposase